MTKRIYVLNGHPGEASLCRSLAEGYAAGAKEGGHEVRATHLHDLRFDPDFGQGSYRGAKALEPDLEAVLADIEWCEHLVLVTPMWWGGVPAKLKGLLDRALLPGRAFDPRNKRLGLPTPIFRGRTGRVIVTSDTPGLWLRLAYGNALFKQLRGQVLGFIGIRPSRVTHLSMANEASDAKKQRWFEKVGALGALGERGA